MIIRNNKGLTLIEILVAIALVGIVLPMITAIFFYALQDYVTGVKYVQQQIDLNSAYMTFRAEYEKAREIKLFLDDSLGVDLNRIQAIEMIYDPQSGVIDYTDEYKIAYINQDEFYDGEISPTGKELYKSKPPFDRPNQGTVKAEIYGEEAFYKRWEFVPNTDDPNTLSLSISTSPGGTLAPVLKNNILKEINEVTTGIFFNLTEKKLWIRILPKPVNENVFSSRNVNEPIEWYFDFAYKDFEFFNE
jgi:prepilin-type N-terminal cleavage/methylation domain-containing protein